MEFFLEHPMLVTYLFLKLDAVRDTIAVITIISSLVLAFIVFIYVLDRSEVLPGWRKYLTIILLTGAVCTIIPSSKDVAIMYGVSAGVTVGKEVATSPITKKSLELLERYIDASLDEAKNKLEKSK